MPTDLRTAEYIILALRMAKDILPWFEWNFHEAATVGQYGGGLERPPVIVGTHPDLHGAELFFTVKFANAPVSPQGIEAQLVDETGKPQLPLLLRGKITTEGPLLDALLQARLAWSNIITADKAIDETTAKDIQRLCAAYRAGEIPEMVKEAESPSILESLLEMREALKQTGEDMPMLKDALGAVREVNPVLGGFIDTLLNFKKKPSTP